MFSLPSWFGGDSKDKSEKDDCEEIKNRDASMLYTEALMKMQLGELNSAIHCLQNAFLLHTKTLVIEVLEVKG